MNGKTWWIIGRALAALLVASALFALPAAASADTVSIGGAADLRDFVARVNNGEAGLDAALTADIVWDVSAYGPWSPIGKWYLGNVTYTGTFDGQGHKISGLYARYDYSGQLALFYGIGAAGALKNLSLDVDFTATTGIAGVAVNNAGTIDHVTVYGSITGTATNAIPGPGGIVANGLAGSVISHCVNSANVTTAYTQAGGIVANYSGTGSTMKYCANHGTVTSYLSSASGVNIGGLVGSMASAGNKIIFSYNAGAIKMPNFTPSAISYAPGGLLGLFSLSGSVVVSCFNYGGVSTKDEVPGAVISGNYGVAKSCITNFADVYYLKASGSGLFCSGTANGADGWGSEAGDVSDPVKARIIEKSAGEFTGGAVLALLNTLPDVASDAYDHYEPGAWRQGNRYPILDDIAAPELDKSPLDTAIAEAEGMLHEAYTGASLAALTSALSAARDASHNASLSQTQAEVDEAMRVLRAAIAALEPVETVKIRSAEELAAFAARVNAGDNNLRARLAADIEVESPWSSIGTAWPPVEYVGVFDGGGHKITLTAVDVNVYNMALFDTIGEYGVVKNLVLDVNFIGNTNVAGVAGINKGRIERVSVYGSIISAGSYAAGVAGAASGSSVISRCVNYADVSAYGALGAGGIAGQFSGTMEYSANYGDVKCAVATSPTASKIAGGLLGVFTAGAESKISNCYNAGAVAAPASTGGLGAGGLLGGGVLTSKPTVVNCFNYGPVTYDNGDLLGAVISGGAITNNTSANAENISDIYYLAGSGAKLFYGTAAAEGLDDIKFFQQTADEFANGTALALLGAGSGGDGEWEQGTDYPVLKDFGAGDINDDDDDDDDDGNGGDGNSGGCDAGFFGAGALILTAGLAALKGRKYRG